MKKRTTKRIWTQRSWLVWIIPAAVLWLLSLWALFVSPIHGFADNGDFWRVMQPAGIEYLENKPRYQSVVSKYAIGESNFTHPETTAVLPTLAARALSSLFSNEFYLQTLGAIYWLIAFAGTWMLCSHLAAPRILLFCWIFVDPNYFLHFNSFFSEAFFLSLFPWVLWTLLRPWGENKSAFAICFLIGILAGISKSQYIILPFIAAVALGYNSKKWAAGGYALAGLVVVAVLNSGFVPPEIRRMNAYQATFVGIAKVTDDPAQSLKDLGVPPQFLQLAGKDAFWDFQTVKTDPAMLNYLTNMSRFKLLSIYLLDPTAVWRSLGLIQDSLALSKQSYLGNFEETANRPGEVYDWPWQFSNLTEAVFKFLSLLVWFLPLGLSYFCLSAIIKKRPCSPLLIFLLLHFWSQLPVNVLGDGFYSTGRHLISARLTMSLLLLTMPVGWVSGWIWPKPKRK